MVQNAPHEPRNSICQVFSQDPSKMSGCLDNSPICVVNHRQIDSTLVSRGLPFNSYAPWGKRKLIHRQMFQISFWILPLYRELLNSARRIRPSASSERARGCTGLVKIICKENKEQRGKRKCSTMLGRLTRMIEGDLPNGLGRAA